MYMTCNAVLYSRTFATIQHSLFNGCLFQNAIQIGAFYKWECELLILYCTIGYYLVCDPGADEIDD